MSLDDNGHRSLLLNCHSMVAKALIYENKFFDNGRGREEKREGGKEKSLWAIYLSMVNLCYFLGLSIE